MEQEDEFYLVLPSNSSMKYFDNTTTNYTTHLERELNLKGHWVMGIAEVHTPQTVVHFNKNESFYHFVKNSTTSSITLIKENLEITLIKETQDTRYDFKHGLYETVDEIAAEINSSKDILKHQKIVKPNRKGGFWSLLRICQYNTAHRTYFNQKIVQVLGFDETSKDESGRIYFDTTNSKRLIEAIYPSCISRALTNQLYIYSDVCMPYNVGDTKSSLLRIVSLNTTNYLFGHTSVQYFAPIHYFPVLKNCFQNININIRDQFGQRVSFLFGTLTVTLHFKRER